MSRYDNPSPVESKMLDGGQSKLLKARSLAVVNWDDDSGLTEARRTVSDFIDENGLSLAQGDECWLFYM